MHVWRRDPPCARRRNKESLLHSPLNMESAALAFHGIRCVCRTRHPRDTVLVDPATGVLPVLHQSRVWTAREEEMWAHASGEFYQVCSQFIPWCFCSREPTQTLLRLTWKSVAGLGRVPCQGRGGLCGRGALVTENPGIKPGNTTVVLTGRHAILQRWMHGG